MEDEEGKGIMSGGIKVGGSNSKCPGRRPTPGLDWTGSRDWDGPIGGGGGLVTGTGTGTGTGDWCNNMNLGGSPPPRPPGFRYFVASVIQVLDVETTG